MDLLQNFIYFCLALFTSAVHYEPTWESLDARPLPSWFDEGKLGIYIHWGVFSVPSLGGEWFWHQWKTTKQQENVEFMKKNYRPDFTYEDFAPQYTAEFYNPKEWVELFKAAGMKYMVFVSKHHEGFTNFPSAYSFNWNAKDCGPNRDLMGELADAVRNYSDIHFGVYYSQFEWYNRLYLQDKANNYTTTDFIWSKSYPVMLEIINKYKPEVFWSDGDWETTSDYWKSKTFLAWLYNERVNEYENHLKMDDVGIAYPECAPREATLQLFRQLHCNPKCAPREALYSCTGDSVVIRNAHQVNPVKDTVVVNDRWGIDAKCRHGGYFTCTDKYDPGHLVTHKWENSMCIDKRAAGYRRNAKLKDLYTIDELLDLLARTISCGGNLLIDVGITKEGTIIPYFEKILRQLGDWLKVNGEAVYSSKPWSAQKDSLAKDVWYTMKKGETGEAVYAFIADWPETFELVLGSPDPTDATFITLLGYEGPLSWRHRQGRGIIIELPPISVSRMPCEWEWVFKITGLAN